MSWKRTLDLAGSVALLLVTSPVLAIAALAIRATMGVPVLYRQKRTGLDARTFTLVKLRTMAPAPPDTADADRITSLGRWLRSTSIDELPQLWNVLRGDMSLVGPRPLLPEYLDRYTPEQARRHAVRPGLTGLAQVSGRNALTWAEKFELDVWYVDHASLALDLRILWRTARCVLRGRGVAAPGHATMPEFR
jgi:lipopolysaccharide/colanic/teichoic acid biosynthesis glycosyltransferase